MLFEQEQKTKEHLFCKAQLDCFFRLNHLGQYSREIAQLS